MSFFTIYSTKDEQEISILRNVYKEENIEFRISEPDNSLEDDNDLKRIEVAEEDRDKARELLDQTGFVRVNALHSQKQRRTVGNKWIFIFLAALVLIIVAILITWFMNVE